MKINCKKSFWLYSVIVGGFVFGLVSLAAAEEAHDAAVSAALTDLSASIGQTVTSEDQAIAICDSEKYFEVCADVGKKHNLYTVEEIQQVDTFISEVRGAVAEQLKSCTTTECLIGVANELAKKVTARDPKLAENFELTATFVDKKQAVITAAKEAGVDYDICRNMDPDTADINTLRSCAKLAKDNRVKDIVPEALRAQKEKYGDYVDKSVELRSSLQTGEFQCGDGTLNGCGNFCLNPGEAARAQGAAGIPPVCRQIAQKFFGADGVKQLEDAYSQVNQVKDYYQKKTENIIFTTIDGRTLTRPEDIGRYMEDQGRAGNVEAVEKGLDFMISKGFVKPEEKEFVVKFVRQARDRGGNIDFDKCAQDPQSCRDFIPEDQRGGFEAGIEIDQIMRQEIGFNPQECSRGEFDPAIGDKCFQGSKRALPKLEALAAKSKEAAAIVAEIKGHLARGDDFEQRKGEIERTFQQEGGPGGCRSEQECRAYCSDSSHGPECIAFGAKQGISGFRGEEAVQKFQEYNTNLQRPQYGSQGYPPPPGVFSGQGSQQGFPGLGYPVQGGFPGQGYPVQGGFPGGQGGYPIPGGFPGGGPVGPSPECFAAIQSGDYAKAKLVCESRVATPAPNSPICPTLYSVDSCPVGEIKVVNYSSPECGTYYSCQKDYKGEITYSPYPYPTGTVPSCPAGQWWDYASNVCRGSTASYSPYPTSTFTGDANSCPGFAHSLWDQSGKRYCRLNGENRCDYNYPSYLTNGPNYSAANCPAEIGATYTPYLSSFSGGKSQCSDGIDNDRDGQTDFPADTSCYGLDDWDEFYGSTTGTYSPYPTASTGCTQSLINLLGTGCHFMYNDGRAVYCDGSMTKSAHDGDTATTTGCTGGTATYSPYPTGGTYSPYPTGSPTSSGTCPSGAHIMYVNNAGGYCMSDADTTKCGPLNSTSTSSFTNSCSSYGGSTYSPYPTSTYTYSPAPACPSGQWWDYARNACVSSTTTYSPYPTSTYTYSPSPTGGTSSCPSGSHSMGSYCMSDADGSKCGPFGSTSTSGFGSCSSYSTTYSPAPTYTAYPTSSYTYTPAPSCPSGQWWDYALNSCQGSTASYSPYPTYSSTYTPYPSPTYTYTPAPTTDPSASCTSSGGTWNGSSCVYPTVAPAPTYSTTACPTGQVWDEATHVCKTAFNFSQHQMAMAHTIMACADSGGTWNANRGSCRSASFTRSFFGNIGRIFARFLR